MGEVQSTRQATPQPPILDGYLACARRIANTLHDTAGLREPFARIQALQVDPHHRIHLPFQRSHM